MSAIGQKQTWGLTIRHVRKGVQGGHCGPMHGLIVSLSERGMETGESKSTAPRDSRVDDAVSGFRRVLQRTKGPCPDRGPLSLRPGRQLRYALNNTGALRPHMVKGM